MGTWTPGSLARDTWAADDALTELYAQHWHALVRLAYLLLRDQQESEEITQDAFVAMHGRWSRLQDQDRALAYLRRSVVNGARSRLRHRGVAQRYLLSRVGSADAPGRRPAASAEQESEERATRDRLLSSLAQLPTRQREVLTLRYYLDLSEAEIADTLGISRGSVKAHASRGLSALRARSEELT